MNRLGDVFGIGQAMKGMAHVYVQSSRRTGRTTLLSYCIWSTLKKRVKIGFWQERLSGYGVPHRETKRKVEEMVKWNVE